MSCLDRMCLTISSDTTVHTTKAAYMWSWYWPQFILWSSQREPCQYPCSDHGHIQKSHYIETRQFHVTVHRRNWSCIIQDHLGWMCYLASYCLVSRTIMICQIVGLLSTFVFLNTLLGGGGSFSAGGPGKDVYSRLYLDVLKRYPWVQNATAYHHTDNDSGLFCTCDSSTPSDVSWFEQQPWCRYRCFCFVRWNV